jgi:hypothetical protein
MDGISVEVGVRRVPVTVEVGGSALAPIGIELSGGGGALAPAYRGPYEVVPEAYFAQTLETKGKRMREDVEVAEIPYCLASNLAGGYTATIG